MDSDDSRDDVSSGSDSESNVKGPQSPNSVQSGDGDSQDYKRYSSSVPQSQLRGPRSPSPCGPRSPSPEGSIQSNSPINSPKRRDSCSPVEEKYTAIKTSSGNSVSSHDGDENTQQSVKSNMDMGDGGNSPKSVSSRSSVKSRDSNKSQSPIKSPSPERQSPISLKSPDNSPDRSMNSSYKSPPERRGPMSPPPQPDDGNTSDSSVSSRDSRVSRGSRRSLASQRSGISNGFRRSRSQESKGSRGSPVSRGSPSSRRSRDSHRSHASDGSRGSSRNKSNDRLHAQAEEISDGEMEYEGGKDSDNDGVRKSKTNEPAQQQINLSHEDLSDVSDLDSLGGHSDEEESMQEKPEKPPVDLRQKLDEAKNRKLIEQQTPNPPPEKTSKTEDGEEQLDFEAEDGECIEENAKTKTTDESTKEAGEDDETSPTIEAAPVEKKEIEEGEVTDDDEVRPEETEPRPVCRFYSRGQCTWGASCRFLHPGVTDKGNYTMIELIRPMVPGVYGGMPDERFDRGLYGMPPIRGGAGGGAGGGGGVGSGVGGGEPPMVESAWERGLRTAKEMMRKASKRKEQDMDFEEKKMNLTLAQDELDKENGYYTRSASPIPVEPVSRHYVNMRHPLEYTRQEMMGIGGGGGGVGGLISIDDGRRKRHITTEKSKTHPTARNARIGEDYYGRRLLYEPPEPRTVRLEPEYDIPRERVRGYRELPPHRMPDYYNDKYEEPVVSSNRRPKREVIVQRIEPSGRGDEWADPWMRSKSPGSRSGKPNRVRARRQSYSSASSYSSSSSSRSTSASSKSSYRGASRSRSRSPSARGGGGGGGGGGNIISASGPSGSGGISVRRRISGSGKSPTSSSAIPHRGLHRSGAGNGGGSGGGLGSIHRTVSPSVIVSEKKAANERAALMNPPAPSPKKAHKDTRPPSPGMMRTSAQNPPAPTKNIDPYGRNRERSKHETDRKKLAMAAAIVASASVAKNRAHRSSRSSSGSDSSGSSSSDSESSYSSSSSSRDGSPTPRRKVSGKVDLAMAVKVNKALDILKTGTEKRQIKVNLKSSQQPSIKKQPIDLDKKASDILQGKKRLATSPPSGESISKIAAISKGSSSSSSNSGSKKSTSRREELLKQLKAVEDAIAKKRSKIN